MSTLKVLTPETDPDFPRRFDVTVQCALERSDLLVHDTLEAVVATAVDLTRDRRA